MARTIQALIRELRLLADEIEDATRDDVGRWNRAADDFPPGAAKLEPCYRISVAGRGICGIVGNFGGYIAHGIAFSFTTPSGKEARAIDVTQEVLPRRA